jgi:hypothetical protein
MEPRKDELKRAPESRKEERKRRFQIVKLEERIAPSHKCRYKPTPGARPGYRYVGHC